ncbi:hypothetical protein [Streptomyces sp. NPDC046261]|uniref:hypothetical protein n=1 Tax=Streptomyces sp. NPDC046261 TaxID=3157200 RepID=UPI0033C0021F
MTTPPSPPASHDPADFASRLTAAEDWFDAAVGAQQEGEWVVTETERRVLDDLVAAADPLHGGALPPHTGDSLYVRVARIRRWAGALRLAARAGGWELFPVTGLDPRALDRPAGMADLLSGIYALAEQGERWQQLLLEAARMKNAAAPDAPMRDSTLEEVVGDLHPRFLADLAAAECFFNGPGSLDDLPQFFY